MIKKLESYACHVLYGRSMRQESTSYTYYITVGAIWRQVYSVHYDPTPGACSSLWYRYSVGGWATTSGDARRRTKTGRASGMFTFEKKYKSTRMRRSMVK